MQYPLKRGVGNNMEKQLKGQCWPNSFSIQYFLNSVLFTMLQIIQNFMIIFKMDQSIICTLPCLVYCLLLLCSCSNNLSNVGTCLHNNMMAYQGGGVVDEVQETDCLGFSGWPKRTLCSKKDAPDMVIDDQRLIFFLPFIPVPIGI